MVYSNDQNQQVLDHVTTVAGAVFEFSALYPENYIFFCGSTCERTRLYRMALSINLEELTKDFFIYGVLKGIDTFQRVAFQKGVDYFGFMIKRKNGAEAIGMKVKVSNSLEKFSGKVLFPEKLEKANNIIARLKTN